MARNGKSINAFAQSIRYLKDQAIEIIRERTGDKQYCEKDIQWVITVPAIWKPAAKQFMREAAYEVYIFLPIYMACAGEVFHPLSENKWKGV